MRVREWQARLGPLFRQQTKALDNNRHCQFPENRRVTKGGAMNAAAKTGALRVNLTMMSIRKPRVSVAAVTRGILIWSGDAPSC
jgi:hypothetical protein